MEKNTAKAKNEAYLKARDWKMKFYWNTKFSRESWNIYLFVITFFLWMMFQKHSSTQVQYIENNETEKIYKTQYRYKPDNIFIYSGAIYIHICFVWRRDR